MINEVSMNLERRLALIILIVIGSSSSISDAQPIGPVGLQRVAHNSEMTGDGKTATPLGLITTCASSQLLLWSGASWGCGYVGPTTLTNTTVTPGAYTYSSITVDAQGRLTAASSGTAPVIGTGTTNTITMWTSPTTVGNSPIVYDGSAKLSTMKFVGIGEPNPLTPLDITTQDDQDIGEFRKYFSGTSAVKFEVVKARGTEASPTTVANGDDIFSLRMNGYDGAAFRLSSVIHFDVDNTVSSGIVPGRFQLQTANASDGALAIRFQCDSAGLCIVPGTLTSTGAFTGSSTGSFGGALNMNSHLIDNVTDPSGAQDAATKHYVDTTLGVGAITNNVIPKGNGTGITNGLLHDDGTTVTTAGNINSTAAIGTVGVTPAAIYTTGTVGIGDGGTGGAANPSTFLDIRHNWRSGWDDLEIVQDGPNSANGIEIDLVRGYGDLSTHTSTTTGTEISHIATFGYDTNNAIKNIGRERWTVDRANSATAVNGAFDLWFTNSANTIQDAFRFDSSHHMSIMDSATPVLTSCGTSPSIVGSDAVGTVTVGSSATGCTITFHYSWSLTSGAAPVHCTVSSESGVIVTYSYSQTAIIVVAVGLLSSTLLDYTCIAG